MIMENGTATTGMSTRSDVLKPMSMSEANISREERREKDDCKDLIKIMSCEKALDRGTEITPQSRLESLKLKASSTKTFSIMFPPGPMGLHLEPNTNEEIGAKVKGYHFSESSTGMNSSILKDKVKKGDVISLVDNINVIDMSFRKVYNILVNKTTSNKLVTFKRINSDGNIDNQQETKKDVLHCSKSPCERNYQHDNSNVLKKMFPVRFDEISHVLYGVGAHIATWSGKLGTNVESGLLSVGTSVEDKTFEVLDSTAKNVPKYSQKDMDFVESKMCAILQELSQTCILLGNSEKEVKSSQQEIIELKTLKSTNSSFGTLQHENKDLTERIENLMHELATEQASCIYNPIMIFSRR